MNGFSGPQISKKRGGLGRTSSENPDAIKGLVAGGVAVSGKIALGEIKKLIQLSDATDLGLNASYDANNKVQVYEAIRRFFLQSPNGTLYIMLVAQTTTLAQMCDKDNAFVYKLVTDESTNREITRVGVIRNPATGYTPTYTTGVDADTLAAVPKAQELCEDLFSRSIFFDGIFIEGRLDSAGTVSGLPNIRALASEYVSIVIAQDPAVVAIDALLARSADVGIALGANSVRKVSECLGSVDIANKPESKKGNETYPLTNVAQNVYVTAQLSSGKKYSDLTEAEKTALETKGYIYAGKYEGLDGFYFNDSHTGIEVTDDYAYMEDNQVFNKAAKKVRAALLPVMKGQVEVDPSTGFLPASVIASYEAKALGKLKPMTTNGEISGKPQVIISPNQDVVGTGLIELSVGYLRQGILRQMKATIGAINPAAVN